MLFQNRSQRYKYVYVRKGAKAMATNSVPLNEVLHSEKHSKLSAEEVAKAVARHNKNHSVAKAENATAKASKTKK